MSSTILTILVGGLLTGCGVAAPSGYAVPAGLAVTAVPTGQTTAEPTIYFPPPTAEAATKIAFVTEVARLDRARETAIALTPAAAFEIWTATPTTSPGPTATWTTGRRGCDVWYSTYKPHYMSCWSGTYDNGYIFLQAGHEGREGADINQGVLDVVLYNANRVTLSDLLYYTPQVLGPIRIVTVSESLVTVAPTEPQWAQVRFVFDLAASQWLPASPVPVGSPSPSGSPSPPP